jgi:hypothetical protein
MRSFPLRFPIPSPKKKEKKKISHIFHKNSKAMALERGLVHKSISGKGLASSLP